MGRDKARMDLDGHSLLERAAATLCELTPDVRLASGRAARYADLGFEEVLDRCPGAGPLAGLEAGLARAGAGYVLVLPVDMPRVRAADLATLLEHAQSEDLDVCVLAGPQGVEPLCGVYHARMAHAVHAALDADQRKVTASFTQRLADGTWPRIGFVPLQELERPGIESNINNASDLERERARVSAPRTNEVSA
jgi:molybdenum cofactor guanylyltransferase